jgi:hypothetical protein
LKSFIFEVGDLVFYDHNTSECGVCFLCTRKDPNIGVVTDAWGGGEGIEKSIIVHFNSGQKVFREYGDNNLTILQPAVYIR